ncbi:Sfi1-domain-containing protein [Glonium stellatum]|uniref:Sfi1-domain-containing protein n=1 Tax=Glonium stellatum TaxID=574774 RepID=A0A8E2JMX4_9PEZI|nr:Sfi1-domain-containing protein [Glonium stellatum]
MPASTADELPPLSNHDVEILYSIVTTAQTLPGPPFRALFAAYDTVLAENGIDPDHDQLYFRFLFRMQEGRAEDNSLYARFEGLLGRMGIQIEVDKGGEGVEDITRNLEHLELNGYATDNQEKRGASRRASFNSMYDASTDTALARRRLSSRSTREERPSSRATDLGVSRRTRSHSRSRLLPHLPIRGRLNQRAVSDNLHNRPKRSGSISSQGSLRITRNTEADNQYDDYSADQSGDQSLDFGRDLTQDRGAQYEVEEHYIPPEMLYQPSETQMISDAETFLYLHSMPIARRLLRSWRDSALELHDKHERMSSAAGSSDRDTLLRQSFGLWQSALQLKRQTAETERFFEHLERRAGKARDLFLLTKAFTHWAQCASDEVQRTSVARRHILRTKYFNSWREITAVNELKVRRQGLRKFLGIWRQRTAVLHDANATALSVRYENLVSRIYWRWFWAFCDRRAPLWNAGRIRRALFTKWVDITRQLREREHWVEKMRAHDVQRRNLVVWNHQTHIVQDLVPRGESFRRSALLSSAFNAIRVEAKLSPLTVKVSEAINQRVISSTFKIWRLRTRNSRLASKVNKLRVIHNAWTLWNDRLRCQALTLQINDRVILQALYKWVLAERASLFLRVHNAQLKHEFFLNWVKKTREQRARFKEMEQGFIETRRTRNLRLCLRRCRDATKDYQDRNNLALSLYEPKLVERTFRSLLERHNHFAQLHHWAEDARFYVLTKHALKCWNDATQQARRLRRREAYAQVRRKTKMGLVRRALGRWRDKTAQLLVKERQATEIAENRLLRTSTSLFIVWHDRCASILQRERQANSLRNAELHRYFFTAWSQRWRSIIELNEQAVTLREESVAVAASSCLKKFEWRIFQIQRGEQNALALRDRNWEKHVRAMIRFWAEQAIERGAQRVVSPSPTPGRGAGRGSGQRDGGLNAGYFAQEAGDETIARAENWTALDESAFEVGNLDLNLSFSPEAASRPADPSNLPFLTSTPLPGYLRTPSKRSTARAKAKERLLGMVSSSINPSSSTQLTRRPHGAASAPVVSFADPPTSSTIITPFERKLRAQGYAGRSHLGSVGSSTGKRSGRSTDRGILGFEDISEEGAGFGNL